MTFGCRLNCRLRIAELENQDRQLAQPPPKPEVVEPPPPNPPSAPNESETGLWNEHEVAAYLKISVAHVCRWRTLRTGSKFVKIGGAVRYRHQAVEAAFLENRRKFNDEPTAFALFTFVPGTVSTSANFRQLRSVTNT